uniref:integrin alpha-D-like n=1 Tax=Pristiophorus japonicus TaxID=55135 RepID=UPI00398E5652
MDENELRILKDSVHTRIIPVQYAVKVIISRLGHTRYVSFGGTADEKRSIQHTYKVENRGAYAVPVNVTFDVPMEIGGLVRWELRSPIQVDPVNGSECVDVTDIRSGVERQTLGLESTTTWKRIFCRTRLLGRKDSVLFSLSGEARTSEQFSSVDVKLAMQVMPLSHWTRSSLWTFTIPSATRPRR